MRLPVVCWLTASISLLAAPDAQARRLHHGVPPSVDALQLAGIASPARRGTSLQTYGDAEIARAQMQRRHWPNDVWGAAEAEHTGGAPLPCEKRKATADPYVCSGDPHVLNYRRGYAYTPSYVSAPTVFEQDPRIQAPIMPDITGFFWSVNSARIDPR